MDLNLSPKLSDDELLKSRLDHVFNVWMQGHPYVQSVLVKENIKRWYDFQQFLENLDEINSVKNRTNREIEKEYDGKLCCFWWKRFKYALSYINELQIEKGTLNDGLVDIRGVDYDTFLRYCYSDPLFQEYSNDRARSHREHERKLKEAEARAEQAEPRLIALEAGLELETRRNSQTRRTKSTRGSTESDVPWSKNSSASGDKTKSDTGRSHSGRVETGLSAQEDAGFAKYGIPGRTGTENRSRPLRDILDAGDDLSARSSGSRATKSTRDSGSTQSSRYHSDHIAQDNFEYSYTIGGMIPSSGRSIGSRRSNNSSRGHTSRHSTPSSQRKQKKQQSKKKFFIGAGGGGGGISDSSSSSSRDESSSISLVDASLPAEFGGGKGHYDGAWSKHNPKSNIKFGTRGGIVETQRGPVLLVFPRYDLLDRGQTVHSNCQFEAHGHVVDDKSIAFGGKQCITTHVGYRIPLDIVNGLAYSKPRPFTNDELRDLPQVEMTANMPWRPSKFNSIISDDPKWFAAYSSYWCFQMSYIIMQWIMGSAISSYESSCVVFQSLHEHDDICVPQQRRGDTIHHYWNDLHATLSHFIFDATIRLSTSCSPSHSVGRFIPFDHSFAYKNIQGIISFECWKTPISIRRLTYVFLPWGDTSHASRTSCVSSDAVLLVEDIYLASLLGEFSMHKRTSTSMLPVEFNDGLCLENNVTVSITGNDVPTISTSSFIAPLVIGERSSKNTHHVCSICSDVLTNGIAQHHDMPSHSSSLAIIHLHDLLAITHVFQGNTHLQRIFLSWGATSPNLLAVPSIFVLLHDLLRCGTFVMDDSNFCAISTVGWRDDDTSYLDACGHNTAWGAVTKSPSNVFNTSAASTAMLCASPTCTIILLRQLLRLSTQLLLFEVFFFGSNSDSSDSETTSQLSTLYCLYTWNHFSMETKELILNARLSAGPELQAPRRRNSNNTSTADTGHDMASIPDDDPTVQANVHQLSMLLQRW